MLLVGRPQSFLEPILHPGKPPVLTCLPVLILVLSSGFSMQSRAKKNTSQDSSFPDCTCPLDTANHFASYLRSRLSQATPRSSRRAERQFMNELGKLAVRMLLHIFTGSVGKRLLIVVPVDTLYRTSMISSSTVVLLNPFANLSLAPLSLFSIYGPDLGVWPDCWVSAEFLRAPIPRKGSGSTTTTVINRCQFISECESSSPKIVTRLVDFLTETSASFIPFQITVFLFVAIIN